MSALSPKIDRCKRCETATAHHCIVAPLGARWWSCAGCGSRRGLLTAKARDLTSDEAADDAAHALDAVRCEVSP